MAKIALENVSVTFEARQQKQVCLKEYLVRGLFRRSVNPVIQVHALDGITMRARDGDRIGVIGRNGAGKSTLLKTLAGVYPPTAGTRTVEGRICSLFDITLGFEFEASGWDNIRYRSYLQGETTRSIRAKIDEIAEFSELGHFLDIPVRNYSAGMMMRLAFAIATATDPEVLLVDEVLSVGDLAFQLKARARMRELMKSSRLMVVVAHDLQAVIEMCTHVIWMHHGRIVAQGSPERIVARYVRATTGESRGEAPDLLDEQASDDRAETCAELCGIA